MKILVVYCSRTGHTVRMAGEIAKRCGAKLDVIQEVHAGDSWWANWRAYWQRLVRATPPIKRPTCNPARYDLVILGTPIWSSGIAPAMRSYVLQYRDRFRQVAFFCAESGSSQQRGFAELSRLCGQQSVATFAVQREKLHPAAHKEGLTDFMDIMGVR